MAARPASPGPGQVRPQKVGCGYDKSYPTARFFVAQVQPGVRPQGPTGPRPVLPDMFRKSS